MTKKKTTECHGFKIGEFVVYPAHGLGQVVSIDEQEVAGTKLELLVINFAKDKMRLRIPTGKIASVGTRKLAEGSATYSQDQFGRHYFDRRSIARPSSVDVSI